MKKLLFIKTILIIFILSTCFLNHARGQESKSKFNKPVFFQTRDTLWTIDTLGCLGYRIKQASIIEYNQDQYIGKSEAEIKAIYGEPNYYSFDSEQTIFVYHLGVTPNCEYIYSENIPRNDIEATATFWFHFKNDRKLSGFSSWLH